MAKKKVVKKASSRKSRAVKKAAKKKAPKRLGNGKDPIGDHNNKRKKPYTNPELAELMGVSRTAMFRYRLGQRPRDSYEDILFEVFGDKVKLIHWY